MWFRAALRLCRSLCLFLCQHALYIGFWRSQNRSHRALEIRVLCRGLRVRLHAPIITPKRRITQMVNEGALRQFLVMAFEHLKAQDEALADVNTELSILRDAIREIPDKAL